MLRRRCSASLRIDQRVKGLPSTVGRVVAASMTKSSSSMLSRRGRPPAHRGSRQASPTSLNRWITSRTVSSSAWTSCAITGTGLPPDDASSIIARRNRTELVLPRRTIRCSFCPSCSVSRRTLTGDAIPAPLPNAITGTQHNEQPGKGSRSQH